MSEKYIINNQQANSIFHQMKFLFFSSLILFLSPLSSYCTAKIFVRAAFYEPTDNKSYQSLKTNIKKMNMVITEYMFINPFSDNIQYNPHLNGLKLIRHSGLSSLAMVSNFYGDDFNSKSLHRILNSTSKTAYLIRQIITAIKINHFTGVNIDFEEINEKSDQPLINFSKALYKKMHPLGLTVTLDVAPFNEDYNLKELAKYNDYLFLMAYDQHNDNSAPGPVSSIPWIKKAITDELKEMNPGKFVLCIAGYGYDWPRKGEGKTISCEDALALAKRKRTKVNYNKNTYDDYFSYRDAEGKIHEVHFTSASSNTEAIAIAQKRVMAGFALWRTGLEDKATWGSYNL